MNPELKNHTITVTTMVVPYIPKCLGVFCQAFMTNDLATDQALDLKVQFKSGNHKLLCNPILLETDKNKFNYDTYPEKVVESTTGFIQLVADRDTDFHCLDFVMSLQNFQKIWTQSDQGSLIQVFDIVFDKELQRDRNLSLERDTSVGRDTFCPSSTKNLFAVGIIENQYSMTISDYEKITKFDPVSDLCKQIYYNPLRDESNRKRMSFNTYLKTQRERFLTF